MQRTDLNHASPPYRKKLLVETLEKRILYSADAGALLTEPQDTPIEAEVRLVAPINTQHNHHTQSETTQQRHEVVLIDEQVDDYQALVDDFISNGDNRTFEIVTINSDDDITQIADRLNGIDDVDAIHLITHGDAGQIQIGNTTLSNDTWSQYADIIASWSTALNSEADILIYGCNVAANADGQQLLNSIAAVTGADIAASTDLTGHTNQHGDWSLERAIGTIETTAMTSSHWQGTLALTAEGSETRANQTTSSTQQISDGTGGKQVAMDANGNFVIVWESISQDGSGYGIYAQRYDADGITQGTEFQVNSTTFGSQTNAAVAMDADGDFVITWKSEYQDGSGASIHAQRFDASGVAQGSEFQVNTYTSSNQETPAIAMDADGDFVITWSSVLQDGSGDGIYAQRYNAAGVAQGAEFQVNTYTSSTQETPDVAMDADGNFVITWTSDNQDSSIDGIFAQRYNASGVAQGTEFQVNTFETSNQSRPSVSMSANGDFVIAWESLNQDGNNYGVYAQRYDAAGAAQGSEFQVNTYTSSVQESASVAMDTTGRFIITWTSFGQDGSSYGVYAQAYHADGTTDGAEFHVSTSTTLTQNNASVVWNGSHIVVNWNGNGSQAGQSDSAGVFFQRYSAPTPPVVTTSVTDANYVENSTIAIDGSITVTDSDSANLTTATIAISSNYVNGEDVLAFTNQLGITGSWNATTGILTLTGSSSVANYQAALRSITYNNTSESPNTNTRTLTITTNDGVLSSNTATRNITVTRVNDAPINTVPASYTTNEETPLQISGLSITDIDDGGSADLTITLSVSNGSITASSSGGVLVMNVTLNTITLTGNLGDLNNYLNTSANQPIYTPTANFSGTATLSMTTDDLGNTGSGGAQTDTDVVTITVNNINDAPTTTPVTMTAIAEDSGARVITQAQLLANASDVEGDTLTATTLAISAGNGNLVDNGDGTWSYTPALNDDTAVSFTYTITDGNDTVAGTANLDITPVNDAGTFGGDVSATTNEDTATTGTVTFTDTADGFTTPNFTINTAATNGTAAINAAGDWTYTPAANFNGSDSFTVQVTDDDGNVETQVINITVNQVNDAPVIDLDANDSSGDTLGDYRTAYTVGGAPVAVADSDTTFINADGTNFIYGEIVSFTGFVDAGQELFTAGGEQFTIGVAKTATIIVGATTFDLTSDGTDLQVTVSAGTGEAADWQSLLASMTYEHTGTPTDGDRSFIFFVRDAENEMSNVVQSTINVFANAAPAFLNLTGSSINIGEDDAPTVLDTDVTITDAELSAADNFDGATLTLTRSNFSSSFDNFSGTGTLSLSAGDVIVGATTIGTYTNSSGVLSMAFNTNATNALVNEAMQQIAYNNTDQTPLTTIDIEWTFQDGIDAQTVGTTTVNITAVDDLGTIDLDGNDSSGATGFDHLAIYYEGSSIAIADVDTIISDVDNFIYGSAVLNGFTGFVDAGQEVFTIGGTQFTIGEANSSTVSYSTSTFDVVYNGTDFTITHTSGSNSTSRWVAFIEDIRYQQTGTPTISDRSFDITLTNTDGIQTNTATSTIRISDNDAPVFSNLTGGSISITEGDPATLLDTDVTITDAELTAADNFDGATLTLDRAGTNSADDIFSATGTLSFVGGDVIVSGTTIGTYTGGTGQLDITFNANATNALVNQAMQQIAYTNTSNIPPASLTINWTFSDGNTGAQGNGGALTTLGTTIVNITSSDGAPISTDDSVTFLENTNQILRTTDFGTYQDETAIQGVRITTLPTVGTLEYFDSANWVSVTLNQAITRADIIAGNLRFVPNADESGSPYDAIGFQVYDGTSYSVASYTLTMNVTANTDAFLQGDYLEVGLSGDGTLGSENDAPTGFVNAGQNLGVVADADRDGWAEYDGDFIMPGSPVENWGVRIAEVDYVNENDAGTDLTGSLSNVISNAAGQSVEWIGSQSGLDIRQMYSVGSNDLFMDFQIELTNTSGVALNDIYYFRDIDPDNDFDQGSPDGYFTTNTIISQGDIDGVSMVTSTQVDGSYFAIQAFGANSRVTHGGFGNIDPREIFNGSGGLSQSGSSYDDVSVSVAYYIDTIADGETTTLNLRYYFVKDDGDIPEIDLDTDNSSGTTGGNFTTSFVENDGPVNITDTDAVIINPEGPALDQVTVTISNLSDGAEEQLMANTTGTNITANYNSGTGVLTLSGLDSVKNYNTVLQSIQYNNATDTPDTTTRQITVTATYDGATSKAVTSFVEIVASNDDPTNTGSLPTDITVIEDVASNIDLSQINLNDVDATGGNLSIRLSTSTGGNLTVASGTGIIIGNNGSSIVTLNGTQTNLNNYLNNISNIQYLHATANTNGNAADSINVTVNDLGNTGAGGGGDIDFGTVNINITQVNDAGTFGGNLSATTNEDTATSGTVTFTDTADGFTTPNFSINTAATNGTAAIDAAGNWTYTPNANFNGSDSFTVQVTDDDGNVETQTISITVTAVADLTAADDSETIAEDTLLSSNVSANDSTTSGGTLTYAVTSGASNGTLNFNADGSYTYQGNSNFNGSDSFTYTVTDADSGESATQTVNLTITQVNDSGTFGGDVSATTNEDTATSGTVTFTDTADGFTTPNFSINTSATNGTAAIDAAGNWTYTPNANFNGADSFTVQVTDDDGNVETQVIAITVSAVNDAPIFATLNLTISEGGAVVFSSSNINSIDYDNVAADLTYSATSVTNGQFEFVANPNVAITSFTQADINNGLVRFVHDGSETAPNFQLTVSDGSLSDGPYSPVVNFNNVNDAPVNTVPGAQTVAEDTSLNITGISINDVDGNLATTQLTVTNGTLSVSLAGGATISSGTNNSSTLTLSGTQTQINDALSSLSYQGNLHYNGSDTLNVLSTDSDGSPLSDSDDVAITVTQVNDAGTFGGDVSATTNEDTATAGTVTFSDAADGYTGTTFAINTAASNGTAAIDAAGNWTYTPNSNFNGSDSFTVQVTDDDGNVETQVIAITVSAVTDLTAADDSATIAEDTLLSSNVSSNDSTTSGGSLTYAVTSGVSNGTLNFNTDGSYTYQGNSNFNGSDSFTYTVTDSASGESATQTVTLAVTQVNDAGTFGGDVSAITNEDTATSGTVTFTDTADGFTTPNFSINTAASNGTTAIDAAGNWTYTPNSNFNGSDSFTVQVTDDDGNVETQVINITVNQVNDAGTFGGDLSAITDEGIGTLGAITFIDAADGSSINNFTIQMGATNGTAMIDTDGNWIYTPNTNFNGSDSFTVQVTDDDGNVETQVINITVSQVNDAGIFGGDLSATTNEATSGTVTFTDTADGFTTPNFVINQAASNGNAAINATGDWTYTPTANFNGSDSFTVQVTDDDGNVETHAINITVNADNNPLIDPNTDTGTPPSEEESTPENIEDETSLLAFNITNLENFNANADINIPESIQIELASLLNNFTEQQTSNSNNQSINPTLIAKALRHELSKVIYENITYRFSLQNQHALDTEMIALDEIDYEQIIDQIDLSSEAASIEVAGIALSAGAIWWALRATGLLASLLTSIPTWRQIDLLAILPSDDSPQHSEVDDH